MPPPRHLSTEAFILRLELSGEKNHRLVLLSAESGLLTALRRRSAKNATSPEPDIFDLAAIRLSKPLKSQVWFMDEYRLVHRHENLGRSYETLRYAAEFVQILVRNLDHAETFAASYGLLSEALEHWETGLRPDVVQFKALFLFARSEGYAVKEDWWKRLPAHMKAIASEVLRLPVAKQRATRAKIDALNKKLKTWLTRDTDILVPGF